MTDFLDIQPYNLMTFEEIDDALAYIEESCLEIDEQLRHPDDDFTFGWLRKAKSALVLGKSLKQRLHTRRGDIQRELKLVSLDALNKAFVDHCKDALPPEQFKELWDSVNNQHREQNRTRDRDINV